MNNFWKKIKPPITVLAPMDDVTDYVFREIVSVIAKPSVLFTEFTSTDGLFSKGHDKVAQRLFYSEKQRPIVAQIWGVDPDKYYKAAQYINELGFDGIDINMGCPDDAVMKKSAGAALINTPALANELILAVKAGAPNLPLSVKTRLHRDMEVSQSWLTFLLSSKIEALILHARTAEDKSKVPAKWEEVGKAVDLRNQLNSGVVLIGNGDVKSYQEIADKYNQYKVDGVMIGRGIFQNPWVFEPTTKLALHTKQEHLNLLLEHTKLFVEKWEKAKNFEIMKKFFKVYVKEFRGADDLRIKLMGCKSYLEVKTIVEDYLRYSG